MFPAHDYNLKCSHLFNVLDTRGAIGVTERANYFRRMRNVTRDVSMLYVAQRQAQDYPLRHRGPEQGDTDEVRAQIGEVVPASAGPQPFVLRDRE